MKKKGIKIKQQEKSKLRSKFCNFDHQLSIFHRNEYDSKFIAIVEKITAFEAYKSF